jgi:metal-sulfur cluster biosynthetic enzyme
VSISEAEILDALATVIDPELEMNIVDLGLVYEVQIQHDAVSILMTMTTPACPIAPHLVDQVKTALRRQFPELQTIVVQLVWEPAWSPLMMSWKAREQFGWA